MPISLLRFVISEYLLSFRKISQGICSHQILQPKGSEAILASPMLEEYMPLPRCVFNFVWMWGVFIHTTYKTKHHVHFTPGTLGPVLPSLKKMSASRCLAHSQLASRWIAHHPAFHRKGVDILKGWSRPAELQNNDGQLKKPWHL